MIRVLVVAASPVVRAGLESLLAQSSSLIIVGAVERSAALGEEIESREPDVVLLDVDDHDVRSRASPSLVTDALSPDAANRAPRLVLLADLRETEWLLEALRDGARAVLPRDASPNEILAAIESAAAGLVALPRELIVPLLPAASRSFAVRATVPPSQPLSAREREVLALLAEGLGNKMIAARLGISEHTVKTHVTSVFAKLEVDTRAEAVARGVRLGVILL